MVCIYVIVAKVIKLKQLAFHLFIQISLLFSSVIAIVSIALYQMVFKTISGLNLTEFTQIDRSKDLSIAKISALLLTVSFVANLIAVGLFVTKYWLMTKKVYLVMSTKSDPYLEHKAKFIFGLLMLIVLAILAVDSYMILQYEVQ